MHFDLVDLRLFAHVAETNSLTRGAERSHMSVSAASVRIKNLEDAVGSKLLLRSSLGVTITQPGQALLHHATLVLRQLDSLRSDLQDYAKGLKGHLRVAASTTAMSIFMPTLRSYLTAHPDVNVDLQEVSSRQVVRAVGQHTADIGIVSGDVRTDDLEVLDYRNAHLVVVTSRDHALATRASVSVTEILHYDFVSLPVNNPMHTLLQSTSEIQEVPLRVRIRVANFEVVCQLVEANVGIGILPAAAARHYAKTMAIAIVPLESRAAADRHLRICLRSLKLLPPFARGLVDLMLADRDDDENAEQEPGPQ